MEPTANFGWPAVQQVRDLCVYFFYLGLSFCSQSSLHSQIMRLDMTYQIVSQSSPVRSGQVNIEHLGNMGFTTISLSSNVKNYLGVRHSFYAIICYNDIKFMRIFCRVLQIPISQYGTTRSLYSLSLYCIVVIALPLATNHTVRMFISSSIDYVLNFNLSVSVSS